MLVSGLAALFFEALPHATNIGVVTKPILATGWLNPPVRSRHHGELVWVTTLHPVVVLQQGANRSAPGFRRCHEGEQFSRLGMLQHQILVMLPPIGRLAIQALVPLALVEVAEGCSVAA